MSARNPAPRLLLHQRLRAGRPPLAVGRPRPQLPRRRRVPALQRARRRRAAAGAGRSPLADSAGGGMHAVMAILAALVRRATHGRGRVPRRVVADGMLGLMALMVDEYLATGEQPGPRHGLLIGRYACYDIYPTRDGGWLSVAAIEPQFWANLCGLLGLDAVGGAPDRRRGAGRDPRRRRARVRSRATATTGSRCSRRRHVRRAGAVVPEVVDDEQYLARGAFVDAHAPRARRRSGRSGTVFAGTVRPTEPYVARDATTTETDELLAAAGLSDDDHQAARRRSCCMTSTSTGSPNDTDELPPDVQAMIGSASTRRKATSPSSAATSGPARRRSRTATRSTGTTTPPRPSPAARSRRRR